MTDRSQPHVPSTQAARLADLYGVDGRVYADCEARNGRVIERLSGGKGGGYSDQRYVRTIIREKVAGTRVKVADETLSAVSAKANATKTYNLSHGVKHKPRGKGRRAR